MTLRSPRLILALALLAPAVVRGQAGNDVGPGVDPPVAVWRFDGAAEPGLPKERAKSLEPGPRPPSYPGFAVTNTAYPVTGPKSGLTVREADLPKANFRFGLGDSITLEAWVKVQELKDGTHAYLVGKGRTG